MKKGIYILPNTLTLCGMFFGFFSILNSIKGNFEFAAWAIFIAGVFDGLDGWVARLTNSTTRFGIELDSLSDLVAFGVAPSVMVYIVGDSPFRQDRICGRLSLYRLRRVEACTLQRADGVYGIEGVYRNADPGGGRRFGGDGAVL